MNKRAITEDLFELLFTGVVVLIVLFFSILLTANHKSAVDGAAKSYESSIDVFYSVDLLLRTNIVIRGYNASVAEFIAMSVEEDPSFFEGLFGGSLQSDLSDKVEGIVKPMNLPIDITVSYKGKSFYLYSSGKAGSNQGVPLDIYSESMQIPSLRGGVINLTVKKYVVSSNV